MTSAARRLAGPGGGGGVLPRDLEAEGKWRGAGWERKRREQERGRMRRKEGASEDGRTVRGKRARLRARIHTHKCAFATGLPASCSELAK